MIYLSAGHNPRGRKIDNGAVANGVREANLTIELRNLISKELSNIKASFRIDDDTNTLQQYIESIKPGSGSVVCDLHFNAGSPIATGVEVLVRNSASENEIILADKITKVIVKHTGLRNRGVKTESQSQHKRLAILHTGARISVLPEICFISNKDDLRAYNIAKEKIAKDIALLLYTYDAMFT